MMNTSTWIIIALVVSFLALCFSVSLALVFAGVKLSEFPQQLWALITTPSDPNVRRWDYKTGKEVR